MSNKREYANEAYNKARDKRVQDVAKESYSNKKITKEVFDALMAYRHAFRTCHNSNES